MKTAKNPKIKAILDTMLEQKQEAMKIENSKTFMPFNVDYLGKRAGLDAFAFSHYYKHPSGDMIADPDMEILYNGREMFPYAYQDSFGYQNAVEWKDDGNISGIKTRMQAQHASFLRGWLKSVVEQQKL